MTVKELIELNNSLGDITITVWGGDNGSKKLRSYCIGSDVGKKPPYPDKRTTYKETAINARDNGKDYYQLLIKQIPKKWLTLEVRGWHVYKSYRSGWRQANHGFEHIYIDVYSEDWMDKVELEKEHDKQLQGQMSFDFSEVMRC